MLLEAESLPLAGQTSSKESLGQWLANTLVNRVANCNHCPRDYIGGNVALIQKISASPYVKEKCAEWLFPARLSGLLFNRFVNLGR